MEFDSILYPHDLFYFGRTVMFYSMVEMIEEGDDVNLINFKSIIDELQLNHNGISPQIQLGKISGAITLQEMICEHKMDLNSVDWSTMIQLTLVKIDDEEIRQGAEEITNMTMIFDKSHNPDDNLEYSVSDLAVVKIIGISSLCCLIFSNISIPLNCGILISLLY